ncbi:hypothetical protein [Halarchaeum sp. P4]|uniref:hypothetical protein n=1 Tax=Halarchaeum sp. P4 TaxID=3421639 RepID=UPI003EC10A8F
MSVTRVAKAVWGSPFGRLVALLLGVGLVGGVLLLSPPLLPVVEWAIPVGLVLWGVSWFSLYEVGDTLSSVAGCLLLLGGVTLAVSQLVPLGELSGVVARLVPTTGVLVALFAEQYRHDD